MMIRSDRKAQWALRLVLTVVIGVIELSQANAAQPAAVVAKASTSSVQVAEPFSVEWSVTAPAGARVTFPANAAQLGDFEIVETEDLFDVPDAIASDARTWTRRMTLESISTGERVIPAIEIQITRSGESRTIRSNPITVRVTSVLEDRGDPTQFRDIQSVVDVDVPEIRSKTWVWWTVGGGLGLTLFAAVGMVLARRIQWVTPKEWAMQELDELENSLDFTTADGEATAVQLSKIIHDYMLLQFAIPQSGYTTQELVELAIAKEQIDKDVTKLLSDVLTLADTAKFGGLQFSPTDIESAIRDSRSVVQRIAEKTEAVPHTPVTTESK